MRCQDEPRSSLAGLTSLKFCPHSPLSQTGPRVRPCPKATRCGIIALSVTCGRKTAASSRLGPCVERLLSG